MLHKLRNLKQINRNPYGASISIERLGNDCRNFLLKYHNTLSFCGISRCQYRNTINTTRINPTIKIVRNDDKRRQTLDFSHYSNEFKKFSCHIDEIPVGLSFIYMGTFLKKLWRGDGGRVQHDNSV